MRSDRRAAELAGLTQATALHFCQYLAMKRDKTNFFLVLVIRVFVFVFVFVVVVFGCCDCDCGCGCCWRC